MGIREYAEERNKKNIILDLEVSRLSDINYWIRSLKYRFKKDKILKINLKIIIFYISEED